VPSILYLHGFNSSPQSLKTRQMRDWLLRHRPDIRFLTPDIACSGSQVAGIIREILTEYPEASVVGSSLGGYYATWASAAFGRKAVLINPAVRPYDRFHAYLGEQQNFHTGEKYLLTTEMVAELQPLEVGALTHPERLWVLLQSGDETLDYRDALARYAASPMLVEEGGNHAFDSFEAHLPAIVHFLTH
jgi:predicted esterase YcpF (UPF0227 family)